MTERKASAVEDVSVAVMVAETDKENRRIGEERTTRKEKNKFVRLRRKKTGE